MADYKGIELADDLARTIRHMSRVEEYREALHTLRAVWDNLSLLGQLSGTGIDISTTRMAFGDLTHNLLTSLAGEMQKKTAADIGFKAQVAIDIMIRNLFERTADIGFLATDTDLRSFAEAAAMTADTDRGPIVERFREYVKKYSVYHNIILMDTQGRVLVQLDNANPVQISTDPLIQESLRTTAAYVETFRATDLQPGCGNSLIYSYRVMSTDGARPVGVLCLCFRFANECERIFANLCTPRDWTLITLLDSGGRVIATSDPYQVPVGAPLEPVAGDASRLVRFAGREYLAATRATKGYQGYFGLGWYGHAMIPVEQAFAADSSATLEHVPADLLAGVMQSQALFSNELREIPRQAERIQRELNRAVWNGNLRKSNEAQHANNSFSKTLLWEVSNTGARTRDVFARSIANLHETVVSSILQDCRSQAALAVDIMDRNLYERANDCRWWALTTAFRQGLAKPALTPQELKELQAILATINGLYTVYSNLLLFDHFGRVIAVSNPGQQHHVEQVLDQDWVRATLSLRDSQSYCVSPFAASPLYDNQPSYIYCAAVRDPSRVTTAVGGIGIVFDSAPQFKAMLNDALPRDESGEVRAGCFGVFARRDGTVIASTDPALPPLSKLELDAAFSSLKNGGETSSIIAFRNRYYAVGARMSSGYREYKDHEDAYRNDVVALVFTPLSDQVSTMVAIAARRRETAPSYQARAAAGENTIEVASFFIGDGWYGLKSADVLEAVDADGITPVPGASRNLRGLLMYGAGTIPVFDLSSLRNGANAQTAGSQVVVVRSPRGSTPFGILVDELGEIPELPLARFKPLSNLLRSTESLAESVVSPDSRQDEGKMLIVLSRDRIAARSAGTDPSRAPVGQ